MNDRDSTTEHGIMLVLGDLGWGVLDDGDWITYGWVKLTKATIVALVHGVNLEEYAAHLGVNRYLDEMRKGQLREVLRQTDVTVWFQ